MIEGMDTEYMIDWKDFYSLTNTYLAQGGRENNF